MKKLEVKTVQESYFVVPFWPKKERFWNKIDKDILTLLKKKKKKNDSETTQSWPFAHNLKHQKVLCFSNVHGNNTKATFCSIFSGKSWQKGQWTFIIPWPYLTKETRKCYNSIRLSNKSFQNPNCRCQHLQCSHKIQNWLTRNTCNQLVSINCL